MILYRQSLSLFAANLLIPAGVVLFIVGFFRGRPPVTASTESHFGAAEVIAPDSAPFDKVIFMMVDALRRHVYILIRSGAAVPFTARAAAPTLTLSRVKALTQGTSQSFLDVWLNVFESENARSLAGADTWLSHLKVERDQDKKMVFYGAELWLDMYADIFDRFEGTDAWYLPEFSTVDSNVTRHLPDELKSDDWKALVLHYLGLDNIAHQGGASGAHMLPKQAEMDGVVKLIYEAMLQERHLQNTLFILLGDHGMTEQGNHGGASPSEIASAMIFISPKLKSLSGGLECPVQNAENYEYYSVINQVDLVPTLAGLMGINIPERSLGIFAPKFLGLFEGSEGGLHFLFKNAQQLKGLLEREYEAAASNIASCSSHCEDCSDDHSQVVCWLNKATMKRKEWQEGKNTSMEEVYNATHTQFCDYTQKLLNAPPNNPSSFHLSMSVAVLVASMALLSRIYSTFEAPWDTGLWVFGLLVTVHGPMMFMNQLVVEEHHYWYWASIAWLAHLGFKRIKSGESLVKAIAYPVALQFLSQSLDPTTNQQHSVVGYIHNLSYDHQVLFWIPGFIMYASGLTRVFQFLGLSALASVMAATSLSLGAISFRLSSTYRLNPTSFSFAPAWIEYTISRVNRNQSLNIFWAGLVACLIFIVFEIRFARRISRKATIGGVVELVNLYLRSLTRSEHLVLFPIFDLQLQYFLTPTNAMSPSDIAVTTLLLGQSAFYASGHGNSFASFDLTNGFNGIESSRALAVALQALLSNYFGPVWWSLASLRMILAWVQARSISTPTHPKPQGSSTNGSLQDAAKTLRHGSSKLESLAPSRSPFLEHLTLQTFYSSSTSLAVLLACIWRRDDPTIWTVLTPKCLNIVLWACFQQFLVNCTLCAGIWLFVVG
ncbi:alkaline phosphatase-like protein [Lepidopterella palustris CBS 459.81]|uniref:GPI ethanolamine phosphate transferase 2 n=1 Tax=Lepidopterella palustris CBS 459.81 TaxID=1314670 RepID=A0A8E2JC08_9PEZI|nr:alkaline phosphatase-like protein [Lepidopterella palustris CBS 459.81]